MVFDNKIKIMSGGYGIQWAMVNWSQVLKKRFLYILKDLHNKINILGKKFIRSWEELLLKKLSGANNKKKVENECWIYKLNLHLYCCLIAL